MAFSAGFAGAPPPESGVAAAGTLAAPAAASAPAPAASRPIVFWGSGSPPAWRVCAVLLEKGIDFDGRRIHFDTGFLKTPDYLALNPRGLVPALIDGDLVLYESLAILHYLEDRYPEVPLMPTDRAARARCLMRMQEANNASSAAGEVVYYVRRTKPEDINYPYLRCKFNVLAEELKLWESYLVGAEYLAGPGAGVSLADFAFFPNLAYMVRLGLELEPRYPNLSAFFRRMCLRPSILSAWPPHWLKSHGLPCLSSSILPPADDGAAPACDASGAAGCDGRPTSGEAAMAAGSGLGPGMPFARTNQAEPAPMSARAAVADAGGSCQASSSSSSSSHH